MTTPTNTSVKNLIGANVWNGIEGTTTTIVNDLISRAGEDIAQITSTTVGYDQEIRYRAAALAVNNVLGGMGPASTGDKDLQNQRTYFNDEWRRKLIQRGYSPDGLRILMEVED